MEKRKTQWKQETSGREEKEEKEVSEEEMGGKWQECEEHRRRIAFEQVSPGC